MSYVPSIAIPLHAAPPRQRYPFTNTLTTRVSLLAPVTGPPLVLNMPCNLTATFSAKSPQFSTRSPSRSPLPMSNHINMTLLPETLPFPSLFELTKHAMNRPTTPIIVSDVKLHHVQFSLPHTAILLCLTAQKSFHFPNNTFTPHIPSLFAPTLSARNHGTQTLLTLLTGPPFK